jgi:hypothetical protein
LRGSELHSVIATALRFGDMQGIGADEQQVAQRMADAIRALSNERQLNGMRLKSYLREEPTGAGVDDQATTQAPDDPSAPKS